MLLIAVAVKISSAGPVFYTQIRHGQHGKPIRVIKFRTMLTGDDDHSGGRQALKGDPRVTKVGKFLRRTSLDELPQFWNVLRGEMSVVGPRPHPIEMLACGRPYEEFDARYGQRHVVRPGITGLAQVNGFRGETNSELAARMRLEYDLLYIQQQSVWLDIKIIVLTFFREFLHGRGY
jgi:lipopolysaccharide/colanic/teichoic acid biosynthesis glycosyltransferase